jgi:hypothetical protein
LFNCIWQLGSGEKQLVVSGINECHEGWHHTSDIQGYNFQTRTRRYVVRYFDRNENAGGNKGTPRSGMTLPEKDGLTKIRPSELLDSP